MQLPEEIEFTGVSPVIPVLDLDVALERFRRLGFSTELEEGPRYGFAQRSNVSLHVIEWSGHDPARTGAYVYLYVSDADALHQEWSGVGVQGELGGLHATHRMDCGSSLSEIPTGRCSASDHR